MVKILDPSIRLPEYRGLCALGVMAKAPRAGKVKTRLIPPLTPDESAALNACFLQDTFSNINRLSGALPVMVYTPQGEESLFAEIVPETFGMLLQRGDGFGQRLFAATEDLLACGFSACCLIDSDSPTVPSAVYQHAVSALAEPGDRIVLGPTDDGGYYLIGLKHEHPEIFLNIAWSTPSVLEETLDRADQAGLDVTLLPRWYDVDDVKTLTRLCDELFTNGEASAGYYAPRTREFVAHLLDADRTSPLLTVPARGDA